MPIPRTSIGARPKAHYTESQYKSFTVKETRTSHYSKVVVGRRNSAGGYAVRAEVPVASRSRFKPPANRIDYTLNFPGTPAAAQQQAFEIAHRLSYGEYAFSLSGIWINPEIECWDTITVEQTDRRSRLSSPTGYAGRFLFTYRCRISDPLSFKINKSAHHMDLSGDAVRISVVRLPDPIRLGKYRVAAGTIGPTDIPGLKPKSNLKPKSSIGAGSEGLKPRSSRFYFESTGKIEVVQSEGLKPGALRKPNVGLKPKTSRLWLSD
jgi:hypothetical protein